MTSALPFPLSRRRADRKRLLVERRGQHSEASTFALPNETPAIQLADMDFACAAFIADLAALSIRSAEDREDDFIGTTLWFRQHLTVLPAEVRDAWAIVDRNGSEVLEPMAPLDYEGLFSEQGAEGIEGLEAGYRFDPTLARIYLRFYWPDIDEAISALLERDGFRAGWFTAMAYLAVRNRRGRRRRGPEVSTTARVWFVEATHALCALTKTDAKRLWDAWFPAYRFSGGDVSNSQYSGDLSSLLRHSTQLLEAEKLMIGLLREVRSH